ncbi:MAG: PaaI family thioesterase [Maricaulaceae bacterium]|jgi:uncharacterized protein (TIGR00369 family)
MSERRVSEVSEGPWAGWMMRGRAHRFEGVIGPFYFRWHDDRVELGCDVDERHLNGLGAAHGGFLMSVADAALFSIAWREIRETGAVTVHLGTDFLAPAQAGDRLIATGEIVKAGGRLLFIRGEIKREETIVLTFDGVIQRLKKRDG